MRLVVRDKYWSVDGGVQGASTFATWEVKAPSGAIGSNAPADNSAIAGLLGQTVNVRHESSTLPSTTGCLDVQWGNAANGQNVQTWECNNTKAQDWRLEQRNAGAEAGRYRLVSGLGDGSTYCLDNRGDYYDSARMGIWSCVGDDHSAVENQTFDLAQAGSQGESWTLTFTRGNASTVLWAERNDNKADGNVGQRSGGSGWRAEWRIGSQSNQPQPVVVSQAGVSVLDASVTEAAGAKLAFEVFVDRPVTSGDGTVSVDYATSDGTATAGADYTAVSGTLTFAAGDQSKTVNVTVLEDSHDDGGETLELTLSNAVGVTIVDGSATGTINNSDPLPRAWLARFGRTVADQVLDGVRERREAARAPGEEVVTLAGQPFALSGEPASPDAEGGLSPWPAQTWTAGRLDRTAGQWFGGSGWGNFGPYGDGPRRVGDPDRPRGAARHLLRTDRRDRRGRRDTRMVGPGGRVRLRRSGGNTHPRR